MPDHPTGFCVYNDAALAIAAMLDAGVGKVALRGGGRAPRRRVQAAFYDDPRVLTISVHQIR